MTSDPAPTALDTQSLLDMAQSALAEMSSPAGDGASSAASAPLPPAEPVAAPPEPERTLIEHMVLSKLKAFDIHGIKGDLHVPANPEALQQLLADPLPGDDFKVLDTLYECWPKETTGSTSPSLLAVALNIGQTFGRLDKLPLSMSRAWRMLHAGKFGNVLAWRLRKCGQFIREWQENQGTFIILDYGEIEMIEGLFEALSPAQHMEVLLDVMNFKVLSNRRMGLLRRVPSRVKKAITPMLPTHRDAALREMAHYKAFLDRLATPPGFPPIIEAAVKASGDVEKMMQGVAAIGMAPAAAPAGGQALGRIG